MLDNEVTSEELLDSSWRVPGTRVELLRSYAVRDYSAYEYVINHVGEMKGRAPTTIKSRVCGVIEKQVSQDLYSIYVSIRLRSDEFAQIRLLCDKKDFKRPESNVYNMEEMRLKLRGGIDGK